MTRRLVLWSGLDTWTAEAARVELSDDGVRATGTQLGSDPLPYRLDYALDATGPGFVTRHLRVAVTGEGWRRTLDLLRGDDDGSWAVETEIEGHADLAAPGCDADVLTTTTLDCDLGRCPLTNLMPVLRHRLHEGAGAHDFTMAWVSVPDLAVHCDAQRYEHVRSGVVRFSQPSGFTAELELDADGLVRFYPEIAVRAAADQPTAPLPPATPA